MLGGPAKLVRDAACVPLALATLGLVALIQPAHAQQVPIPVPGGNTIVQPSAPAPANVTVHVEAPPPDPQAIADASVQSSSAIAVQVAAPIPVNWANQLFTLPDIWRQTPDDLTWNNGQLRTLALAVQGVAFALLGVAVFTTGLGHALGQGGRYGRLVYGAILALGNLTWWEIGIKLNNAICAGIGAPDLPSLVKPHLTLPAATVATDPAVQVATVALVVVYAVVALLTGFALIGRLALIQAMMVTGALALFGATTEQSAGLAQKYVAFSVGLLFSQVLIVLAFKVVEIDGALGAGIASTLVALALLLQVRKMPALLSSAMSSGPSAGRVVRIALATRRLAGMA